MNDAAAFLRAVIANPQDDLPRLILADFLDERNDEWAGLIRCQIELAHIPDEPLDPRRDGLNRLYAMQQRGVLNRVAGRLWPCEHGYERRPSSGDYTYQLWRNRRHRQPEAQVEFHRGLIESVSLPLGLWLSDGPSLVRSTTIRQVRLSDRQPWVSDSGLRGWQVGDEHDQRWHYGGNFLVPDGIFRRLRRATHTTHNGLVLLWPTEAAALAALSQAAIARAKSVDPAALPPTLRRSLR